MITPQELARGFAQNTTTVAKQLGNLSHADSIIQPPVPGNCLNWVLGHIVDTRSSLLTLLGQPALITDGQHKRYGFGSEPVCADGDDIIPMGTLLNAIATSQPTIEAALASKSEQDFTQPVQSYLGTVSLGFQILLSFRHETYHLGQTEILRELAVAAHA